MPSPSTATTIPHPLSPPLPTVTLLIGNMHCTSCCDAISSLLSALPSVRSVTTSLLLRTVTFSIDTSQSQSTSQSPATVRKVVDQVVNKLQGEGGFVVETEEDGEEVPPPASSSPTPLPAEEGRAESLLSRLGLLTKRGRERKRLEERRRRHVEHCEACQAQEQAARSGAPPSPAPLAPPKAPGAGGPAGRPAGALFKSTFSIEGMTCASCTSAIVSALEQHEGIIQVDINLLNSSGIVRHRAGVDPQDVARMIEDAGYGVEVVGSEMEEEVVGQHPERRKGNHAAEGQGAQRGKAAAAAAVRTVLSIEGMTCASCTSAITSALEPLPEVESVEINLLTSSGVVRHRPELEAKTIEEIIDDLGYAAEVVRSEPEPAGAAGAGASSEAEEQGEQYRSTFSIEGMTCASCSSAITSALTGRDGITAVHVDLLNNRAVVEHSSGITAEDIADEIEDLGYGAELASSSPIAAPTSPTSHSAGAPAPETRTLQIRVDGLFCDQCVLKINSHLSSLPLLSHTPISLRSPIVTLTYKPHHPLTVRDIIRGLNDLAPEFEAGVQKTQSLSERSRKIQRREVRVLGVHLAVAFVLAIPTFIVAIVAMILVPGGSDLKMKVMEPKWGAANLGTLILWPLATIVQFGVGRLFYQRTFASLWPHLRSILPRALIPASQRRMPARPLGWRTFFSFGSMDLLVALSTTVSYFASLAMLIIDVRNPPTTESVGTYFDSCVFLIMFILLGRTLEAYAKSRTTDAVSLLGDLRPNTALLVERRGDGDARGGAGGDEEGSGSEGTNVALEKKVSRSSAGSTSMHDNDNDDDDVASGSQTTRQIPVDHLELDDLILLPPGSLPPTDAIIVSGHTTFDESSLTGESHAIPKSVGDEIFTGTTNLSSAVTVRVTRLGGDTMIEKIIRAVSDASSRKAPLEKLAERLTGVFVPLIVYLSLIVLAVWLPLSLTGTARPHSSAGGKAFFAIEFAIATLVVACPCGIGLAVPCANAVGNGVAAKAGILAGGGGEAFLGATRVERVVFDKTGTLTVGRSKVTGEQWAGGTGGTGNAQEKEKDAVRRGVVEIERGSTHPLAKGLVEFLDKPAGEKHRDEQSVEVLETKEIAGRGLKARVKVDGGVVELLVGNVALMTDYEVGLEASHHEIISTWSSEAKSVVLVASSFHGPVSIPASKPTFNLSVLFSLSDPPRPESASLIAALRKRGIAVGMLSGDNEVTARAVGKMVGLGEDEVKGGVGPEGKAEVLRVYQEREGKEGKGKGKGGREVVMFVGDGLNDAVALAAADVSCAMGHGSQATLASADFILLSSSLSNLLALLRISRKVINRQRLNLGWALVFNAVCLPFAAGVFYPAGGIRLTPVWSAVLMAASSVSVVCSSLAMRWGL